MRIALALEPPTVVSVYWAASGDVWAGEKMLGNPHRIAAIQPGVVAIATDRDRIYWATEDAVLRVAR